ncbi:MAG: hypothetical protein PHR55_01300 [Bacilli bacterium]|nr:hypothetical protein [Bacilli bacterium]MDD4831955.1 hypothetical protein [Bacilli bacterium]
MNNIEKILYGNDLESQYFDHFDIEDINEVDTPEFDEEVDNSYFEEEDE